MTVDMLRCRECRAEYALEALYVCERCFGPLEVAYDHSRLEGDVGELRRRIQGGPQNIWRYADFLPTVDGPPGPSGRLASRAGLPAGRKTQPKLPRFTMPTHRRVRCPTPPIPDSGSCRLGRMAHRLSQAAQPTRFCHLSASRPRGACLGAS
jgi:hypothetical protein